MKVRFWVELCIIVFKFIDSTTWTVVIESFNSSLLGKFEVKLTVVDLWNSYNFSISIDML